MFIRAYNQAVASQSTQNYNALRAPSFGMGNKFVGGAGNVSVSNQTEDFICLGGQSQMFVANRGNNAYIQGGSAGNEIISVGSKARIIGSSADDKVFSIGYNCDISLGCGNDQVYASGGGTIVDGGDGHDLGAGTLSSVDYNNLFSLDVMSMLAKIRQASINYLTR